ncbi:hypothetical protein N665_0334s0008 [Sinapis alba]|nr:hypothetical protein N665_0334s0008 [Sinapis alba]
MDCLVSGVNFLLKAIRHEAFTNTESEKEFVQIQSSGLSCSMNHIDCIDLDIMICLLIFLFSQDLCCVDALF